VLKIAPAAFWRMTPAGLAAAFREYVQDRREVWDAEQREHDVRAARTIEVIAATAGESKFDGTRLFSRLRENDGLTDDDRIAAQWIEFAERYQARRTPARA
jgi:hypothetical protein